MGYLHCQEPPVPADSVIFMHNKVTCLELAEAGPRKPAFAFALFLSSHGPLRTEYFIFADYIKTYVRPRKALWESTQTETQPRRFRDLIPALGYARHMEIIIS